MPVVLQLVIDKLSRVILVPVRISQATLVQFASVPLLMVILVCPVATLIKLKLAVLLPCEIAYPFKSKTTLLVAIKMPVTLSFWGVKIRLFFRQYLPGWLMVITLPLAGMLFDSVVISPSESDV